MADKNEPRRVKVFKGQGTEMKCYPPKRTEGLGSRKRDIPSDEPRRIKVFKGEGTDMRYYPPKLTDGLQRWANPAPTNNPDRKAQDEAQPNAEQD